MKKISRASIIIAVVCIALAAVLAKSIFVDTAPRDKEVSVKEAKIFLPKSGSAISTPVRVEGEAPGTWYFEANLVVRILDKDGTELGIGPATAEGEWMTENLVPFSATIPFDAPHSDSGFVEVLADDPAGLGGRPSMRIPVKFDGSASSGALCTSTIAGACAPQEAPIKSS